MRQPGVHAIFARTRPPPPQIGAPPPKTRLRSGWQGPCFGLPRARSRAGGGSATLARRVTAVNAKILVVDDNAQNRALAQATLEDEGYQVILADGGEAGLRAVQEERPDCVL